MLTLKNLRLKITTFLSLPENFTDNKIILKYVIFLYLGWRISLFIITFLGLSTFPNLDFYHKQLFFPQEGLDYWSRWANWDSGAYLYIAQHGYTIGWTVFFPIYPLLIKIVSFSGLNYFWSAFFISQIATITLLFYFFKLIILDFDGSTAKKALLAILIFPASFYLGAIYSEALSLAFAVMAFYYARQKQWPIAAICAALASTTRLIGIGVIIGILIEYLWEKDQRLNLAFLWQNMLNRFGLYLILAMVILAGLNDFLFRQNNLLFSGVVVSVIGLLKWLLIPILLIFACQLLKKFLMNLDFHKLHSINFVFLIFSLFPFLLYLLYQQIEFNSFFAFIHSESSWGKILSFPWQGPIRDLSFTATNLPVISEFAAHTYVRVLVFIIALACLIASLTRLRFSYTVYYLIAFLVPLFSGTMADITRYTLVIFPMFIILATIRNQLILNIGALLSALLLSMLSILYFNSYFFI